MVSLRHLIISGLRRDGFNVVINHQNKLDPAWNISPITFCWILKSKLIARLTFILEEGSPEKKELGMPNHSDIIETKAGIQDTLILEYTPLNRIGT